MSCEHYKSWIEDAAVEALDSRHASELNAHLEHCAACRALLGRERALTAAIDSTVIASVKGEPSPYFATRVRARIAEGPQRAAGWFPNLMQWLPLTAGAMVMVAAVGIWMSRSGPNRDPRVASVAPAIAAPAPVVASEVSVITVRLPGAPRRPAGPSVLVAPDEKAGFRTLYEFARAQRIAAEALPNVAESRKPLDTPELKIKPMEIAALDLQPPAPAIDAPAAPRSPR